MRKLYKCMLAGLLPLFCLLATPAGAQYFNEDFENGGTFPSGWTLTNGTDDWQIGDGTDYGPGAAHSGTYCAYFNDFSFNSGTTADMITPAIDLQTASSPQLTFWYFDEDDPDTVQILVSTDGTNYTPVFTTPESVDPWTQFTVDLSAYAGSSTVTIAFRGTSEYDNTNPTVDDVVVAEAPTCPAITGLVVNSMTANSANISWIAGGSETAWNVEYGPAGYTPGNGTMLSPAPADTFAVISGLSVNTSYDMYVQADCGSGDLSTWSGPLTVYTGYCVFSTDETDYYIDNFVTSNGASNISNTASGIATNGYGDYTSMTVSQYEGADVDVDITFGLSSGYTFGCNIWIDWNNDLQFDASEEVFATGGYTSHATGTISVPVGTPVGNYTMRVAADYNDTDPQSCTNDINGEVEDYTFTVIPVPSCVPVTGLVVNELTSSSANISWVAGGSETAWNVEYGPAGYTPGTGTVLSPAPTDTFAVINGLTFGSDYDFYVMADCGGGDQSTWAGPLNVFIAYCVPSSEYTSDYLEGITTSGGTQNVSYSTASIPGTGYADESAQIVSTYAGGSFDFETEYVGGGNGVKIWVDWNDNLDFEASEVVFYEASSSATKTGTISVPSGVSVGDYRIRFRGKYGSSADPQPCGETSFGSTVDFTLHVEAAPSCLPVSDLGVMNVLSTTADVFWTVNGTETSWIIEYGPQGFTQGSGITENANANPFGLSSLTPDSDYEFYVKADCGGGDESTWAGPFAFHTPCVPMNATDLCESFEPTSANEGCWTVINGNDDNDSWNLDYATNPYDGDEAAMLYTDYNDGDNDDWLITPNITLTGNEVLNFFYRVQSSTEPNDFEVLLSTTSMDAADFTDTLMHLDSYDNTSYMDTSIDLSAFTGDVFIAFHVPAGGADGYRLYIDQVCFDICTPAPGIDGTADVCRLDNSVDLSAIITAGEPNGTWTFETDPQRVSGSDLNIVGIASGTYEVNYIVTTACTSDTTVAVVNVFDPSHAGTGGSVASCNYGPFNLFDALGGTVDLGGTWYDASGTALDGALVNFNGELAGSYNYDYITSNNICPEDTATVEVQLQDCAGIDEQQLEGFALYPNPTSDFVSVSYEGAGVNASLKLVDIRGAVVFADQVDFNNGKTYQLDLSSFESGVYMLTIQGEKAATVIRVIKN